MTRLYRYAIAIVLTLILTSMTSPGSLQAQPVRDRLLGDVEIKSSAEGSTISVGFTFPVRYVRHFPLDIGKEVRIQLRPIAINQQDRDALFKRESVIPRPGNPAFANEIVYEGDVAGGPYLTVMFDRPVQYQVKEGNDYRSILILVARAEAVRTPGPEAMDERARQLQTEAQAAMSAGNFSRAVQIYTKLAGHDEEPVRRAAQEMLGVARERNGQLAHARAEYRRYLELYPESEGADRVRARLDALLSEQVVSEDAAAEAATGWQSDFYGALSQFYDREEIRSERVGNTFDRSSLDTNLDLTMRLQNQDFDIRGVLVGGHEEDFLEKDDSDTRANSLYLELNAKKTGINTRIGRQSKSSGGVLGRFDGGLFGFHFTPHFAVSLVGGFPVVSSSEGLETDKYFYGASLDFTSIADRWDFSTYYFQQETDELTDRQAIGAEIRFQHRNGSMFALVDYDLHFEKLNAVLFSGNLVFADQTILGLSADYRKSPSLATSNALIGQSTSSLEDLQEVYSDSEIKQLAKDRTATSKTATISLTRPITDKLQVAADVSWAKLEETEASGGVDAFEATDDEFFYALQLIGNSLIKAGDLASIGVRYADTTSYDSYSATFNTRFPFDVYWRINPKFYVDYREHKVEDQQQWTMRPSLRIDFRMNRTLRFEIEGGYEWSSEQIDGVDEDSNGYFFSAGYRWDF